MLVRFRINALAAEVVSLNTLGLGADAMRLALRAKQAPGYTLEPESWMRTFLEQRLTSMASLPRFSIYDAEKIADQALELVPTDAALQTGIRTRLTNVYLVHGTPRSIRKAGGLVEELRLTALNSTGMSPLRQVLLLRAVIRYFRLTRDREAANKYLLQCRSIADSANLAHQRAELDRDHIDKEEPQEDTR